MLGRRKSPSRQDFIELSQSYQWEIERLESENRRLKQRVEDLTVAAVGVHRRFDQGQHLVVVYFDLYDMRALTTPEIARYVAETVTRKLLELPDYRADLREYAETGRTISFR